MALTEEQLDEIRHAIQTSGYKKGFLARMIKAHKSTLSRFVNGHSELNPHSMRLLLQKFNAEGKTNIDLSLVDGERSFKLIEPRETA